MKKSAGIVILIIGMFLVVYLTLYLCNTFLLKRDSASYLPIYEIKHRDDIDMVFIGSSIVRNGINPAIIEEETGLKSFDLGIPGMKLPGIETCVKFVEKKNHPKYIIVVTEPDVFTAEVATETNMVERIWPHLETPMERFMYYLDLCTRNGAWIENALIFQRDMIETMDDFKKVITIEKEQQFYADDIHAKNPSLRYEGKGFLRVTVNDSPTYRLSHEYHSWNGDMFYGINPDILGRLLDIRKMCESLNAEMIVMIPPTHTVNILSYPADMAAITAVGDVCRDNGITFWNFRMVRRNLWSDLDPYFYDIGHLNGTGADLFSQELGRFIMAHMSGEDLSGQFYDTWEDYLEEAPLINAWMDFYIDKSAQIHISAGYNGGTSVVPEFQFAVRDNGSETVLKSYNEKNTMSADHGTLEGKEVSVTVKDKMHPETVPVFYECVCP